MGGDSVGGESVYSNYCDKYPIPGLFLVYISHAIDLLSDKCLCHLSFTDVSYLHQLIIFTFFFKLVFVDSVSFLEDLLHLSIGDLQSIAICLIT